MGLANFLFSFGLLEALDHRASIGGGIKKLSYANMILACLRHPCTLSLGVLAPRLAFSDSTTVPWLGSMSRGIRAVSSAGIQRTSMCLAALSFAQVAVRLTENLLILFRYGRRDASSVKLADFFEFILDGIFLAWMMLNLYLVTHQISRDHGGRLIWSWSNKLSHFWVLYAGYVVISGIQSLIGILHYVVNVLQMTEHFMFTFYKINAVSDLVLLTGIAILLRPEQQESPYSVVGDSNSPATFSYEYRDGHMIQESPLEGETADYSLLLVEEREGRIHNDAEAQA
ncbi:MAG: hypothetical protein SGARI_005887, partial [Bacillariaceae sp.]